MGLSHCLSVEAPELDLDLELEMGWELELESELEWELGWERAAVTVVRQLRHLLQSFAMLSGGVRPQCPL